tara:strand:- start:180 stop:938 length:759 start_codon:yes stop_codon:yes gene_type:complete
MKKIIVITVFITSLLFPWGKTGHRITGEVAEAHLTEKAKIEIAKILSDPSLANASTWADEMRPNPDFQKYSTWHYANMPLDKRYSEHPQSKKGDIVQAIKLCKAKLKNPNVSKNEKAFHLRFLVHLVGDIHQPLHVGRGEDRGGNDIKVKWFGKDTNLHRVWDSEMINTYMMSYSEFTDLLMRNFNSSSVEMKSEEIWIDETQKLVIDVYANAKNGDSLGYDYIYENFDIVKSQLFIAGVRLAQTLNDIFDG